MNKMGIDIEAAAKRIANEIWGFSAPDWNRGDLVSSDDRFNEFVRDVANKVVDAALSDTVLYKSCSIDDSHGNPYHSCENIGPVVQVWPHE